MNKNDQLTHEEMQALEDALLDQLAGQAVEARNAEKELNAKRHANKHKDKAKYNRGF